MNNSEIELSMVIPVYNEEENLPELIRRMDAVCDAMNTTTEVILVDDGSSDHSMEMIRDIAEKNPRFVGVILTSNFGQHAAVTAGLQTSRGKYVVTLDADLQNPPEEIPKLLEKLREGYDAVGSIRENRQDTFFRKMASKQVNRMVRKLCHGKTMSDYGCMLRGYSRPVVDAMLLCKENGKFIPMLAMNYARKTTEIHVKHAERAAGVSKYSLLKLIALQYDLLTGTSTFPLRMLTFCGFLVAGFGFLFGIIVFIMSQLDKSWGAEGTFALFAIVIFLMGGQFAGLGLLGEYVGKIHLNTMARPQFFIESIITKHNDNQEK